MKNFFPIALGLAALACPMGALAQTEATAPPEAGAGGGAEKPDGLDALGFGVGVGLQLGASAVDEATIEAGIVRVSREADAVAGLVLEGHYLLSAADLGTTELGVGPFVAVQAGSSDVVDSIGIGIMFGLRREENVSARGWGSGFNIGIGAMFDPNVKKLGDGIVRNEPLPPGETQIRYREEHAFRGMVMVTYSP